MVCVCVIRIVCQKSFSVSSTPLLSFLLLHLLLVFLCFNTQNRTTCVLYFPFLRSAFLVLLLASISLYSVTTPSRCERETKWVSECMCVRWVLWKASKNIFFVSARAVSMWSDRACNKKFNISFIHKINIEQIWLETFFERTVRNCCWIIKNRLKHSKINIKVSKNEKKIENVNLIELQFHLN